jgi:putative membrane protein
VRSTERFPRWVYRSGEDPDYRFSFANERTYLAWIRTALSLVAAGVAVDALSLDMATWLQRALAVVLVALGLASAIASWTRWARSERAIRRGEPLPSSAFTAVLAGTIVLTALAVLAAGL